MYSMHATSETELIAQSLNGDTEAYGQLVDRYKQAIYRHCYAIVGDEDSAEDMAQEAFIAAYYQLTSYNDKYKFSTWLFKISTNKCLNHIRRKKRETPLSDEWAESLESDQPTPERNVEASELHDAVRRLSPKYRSVISLHYWQGMHCRDIAVAMQAPASSVRVWLLRAKQQLRKELS